jgi:hypothetical protein
MPHSAIVVVAIGADILTYWRTYCETQCRAYASKCGYDLILVTEPLDRSPRATSRSAAWQKCLVLSQDFSQQYQQIISLDSDIVINPAASPPISDQVPVDHVGGVICGSHIHEDLRCLLAQRVLKQSSDYARGLKNWEAMQRLAYEHYGLEPPLTNVVQTGVLVASPLHHRQIFEAVYHAPEQHSSRSYEQVPLSHALLTSRLFCQVDTRFNSVFHETALVHYPYLFNPQLPQYQFAASCAVQTEFANNFFLHFAYDRSLVRFVPQ